MLARARESRSSAEHAIEEAPVPRRVRTKPECRSATRGHGAAAAAESVRATTDVQRPEVVAAASDVGPVSPAAGLLLVPGSQRWEGLRYLVYWGLASGLLVLVLGLVGFISLPSVRWAPWEWGFGGAAAGSASDAGEDPAARPLAQPAHRAPPRRLKLQDAPTGGGAEGAASPACSTPACAEQASRIQAELEYSVDPCVDFYHFVCSRWIQRHPGGGSVDLLQLESYTSRLADLLERPSELLPEMQHFFENCLRPQENLFSEIRATFFYLLGFQEWPYLSSAASFIAPDEVSSKIGAVFRELGVESLFRFTVAPDPDKPRLRYWALDEPRLLSTGGEDGAWMDAAFKASLNAAAHTAGASRMIRVTGFRLLVLALTRLRWPTTEGVLKDSFPLNELVLVKLKALLDFYGKFSDTNVSRLEHELSSLMERPELDPLALSRCKTMALVDLPSIDYLRWAPMLRSAFGTEDIFPQVALRRRHLVCSMFSVFDAWLGMRVRWRAPATFLGLFNRGSLPRVTDLLNYVLFRIVAALSPFMANATLRDAMSRAYATPGSGPLTPRQLCVRLLDRFEPAVPMYLAANMSLAYLGAEGDVQDLLEGHLQVVFEKYVDEFFKSTGDFRTSALQTLRDMGWDLVRPSAIEDEAFRRQYLDGLAEASARRRPQQPSISCGTGWTGGFLSAYPRLAPPFRRLEIPLPVFNMALGDDPSVRHLQIPRVAPRVYAALLRFLYHSALNANGNSNLTEATEDAAAMFQRVRVCVEEQYAPLRSSSAGETDAATSSSSVQDMLDVLSVVPAFEAYRAYLTAEFRLQTAADLNSRQLFFVYYAASHCADEAPRRGRSPARLRVNGPLRNMPEFADAFKCPVGSFMNPTKVCAL
ncbi:hypothetical protein MRX96_011365 [Rhipicephalus microplus]